MTKKKTRKVTRSAKTGKFVKKEKAETAPSQTVTETVPITEKITEDAGSQREEWPNG